MGDDAGSYTHTPTRSRGPLSKATACPPSVVADTIVRTIELGITITDAAVDETTTTIFCAPVTRDPRCPDCGGDTVTRPLTDLPVAGYPLVLQVAVPRYRCLTPECGRAVFNQNLGKLAAPRASTTRRYARYVLRRLMIDRTTISAIAAELGVSWHTVSAIAMRAVADLITAVGPAGFVTLIIDLTPTRDQTGPARLLDMVKPALPRRRLRVRLAPRVTDPRSRPCRTAIRTMLCLPFGPANVLTSGRHQRLHPLQARTHGQGQQLGADHPPAGAGRRRVRGGGDRLV